MNKSLFLRGFSLVELLVVISIIGILVAVIAVNFGDARIDAQNKGIQAELKEMQLAIELYKAQNDHYPDTDGTCDTGNASYREATSLACDPYIIGLAPQFIADLLSHDDAANSNCVIKYRVGAGGAWYKLTAQRCFGGATTPAEGVQPGDEMARCPASCDTGGVNDCAGSAYDPTDVGFYESYGVYSVGGECE